MRPIVVALAALLLPAPAAADSPAPLRDFTQAAGAYVFVMLAPADTGGPPTRPDPEIRKVYQRSGLYRKSDPGTPLWTVDWYAFEVFPSADGAHLARIWPWAATPEAPAVTFYRSGQELRTYRVRDLVRDESKLVRTVSFLHWKSDVRYNEGGGILFLITVDHQLHRFSVKTGARLP